VIDFSRFLLPFPLAAFLVGAACSPPAPVPRPDDSASVTSSQAGGGPRSTTTKPSADPAAKTLFVADQKVDCEGEGPMKCLRVRDTEAGEWRLLYQSIEGFTHEAGHAYELRVSEKGRKDPPADGSSVRYVLVEIVSKKKIEPAP